MKIKAPRVSRTFFISLTFCFKFCFENNDVWNDCGNCLIRQRIVGIKILTWCQFPAGRHGTVSRKRRCSLWQNMENKSRGINMKLTAYLLLATFYSSAHACRACAFIQQEMEHLWFFFLKIIFFFYCRWSVEEISPFWTPCIKLAFSSPWEGLRAVYLRYSFRMTVWRIEVALITGLIRF